MSRNIFLSFFFCLKRNRVYLKHKVHWLFRGNATNLNKTRAHQFCVHRKRHPPTVESHALISLFILTISIFFSMETNRKPYANRSLLQFNVPYRFLLAQLNSFFFFILKRIAFIDFYSVCFFLNLFRLSHPNRYIVFFLKSN